MVSWDTVWEDAIEFAVNYVPKLVGAIIIWIIGICIINKILHMLKKKFKKKSYDPTLSLFLLSLLGWVLKIILFLILIDKLGVEITTFAAILAGLALAIGLAM